MDRYEVLKEVFNKEKNDLLEEKEQLHIINSRNKRILNAIVNFKNMEYLRANYSLILGVSSNFPQNEKDFEILKRLLSYKELIEQVQGSKINFDDLESDICLCCEMYNTPPKEFLNEFVKLIRRAKSIASSSNRVSLFLKENPTRKKQSLIAYLIATCYTLALKICDGIKKVIDERIENIDYKKKSREIYERVSLIEKYSTMFSRTHLLSSFQTQEELDEFMKLIKSLLDDETCLEILKTIREDQISLETVNEEITFSNLDLSKFKDEDKKVIEDLREIYEEEFVDDKKDVSFDDNIKYDSRLNTYNELSMNEILHDVRNLLQQIYDNPDVIKIFKLIIGLYNKQNLRNIRKNMIMDLSRIINEFNSILDFINRTYKDQNELFKESQIIKGYINTITNQYLPFGKDLWESDLEYDETLDGELDNVITKYKNIIKKWKKEMSLSYKEEDIPIQDVKENTDNLVFCLEDDIDLSDEGHRREFVGAIEALEMKSSRELKGGSGRNGMTRLRKSTETGDEKDFVDYINNSVLRGRGVLHFVPYRYSNNPYYRTGLIKFEPSKVVKEFLEERYGLSKQSAFYGVFRIIHSMGADHSEYKFFEEYLLDNYQRIEELALLFASDNPDYDRLVEIIERMLQIKKDKLNSIESRR